MDGLLGEIAASKRKATDEEGSSARPNKYMKKGDIERVRIQQEQEQKELKQKQLEERRKQDELEVIAKEAARIARKEVYEQSKHHQQQQHQQQHQSNPDTEQPDNTTEPAAFNPPPQEITRRLRLKAQPIRLFGEDDKDRRLRLRALELMEERGHGGGQNDFKKALEGVSSFEKELMDKVKQHQPKDNKKKQQQPADNSILDLSLIKSDPSKLHPLIYYTLKRRLKEWGEAMDQRPEEIKRTTQGKLAAATQVQSAEYLKPLFKQLRTRTLPEDMVPALAEIVHHMQARQYQRANDSYLRLSIGNAPWPIGVTMVGIHERSAREKISSDQVAHVLNDEVSRKYIQSLKRLLTFSQTIYPPDDPSQLMG